MHEFLSDRAVKLFLIAVISVERYIDICVMQTSLSCARMHA